MTNLTSTIKYAIMNMISFCQNNLDEPLWENGPTGSQYKAGLVRVNRDDKNRKSFVEGLTTLDETIRFLVSLDWEEIFPSTNVRMPNCRYFRSKYLDLTQLARTTEISLHDAQKLGLQIRLVDGDHGQELNGFINYSKPPITTEIHLIIENEMMTTWYPGPLLSPTPEQINPNPETWDQNWTVKLSLAE